MDSHLTAWFYGLLALSIILPAASIGTAVTFGGLWVCTVSVIPGCLFGLAVLLGSVGRWGWPR